MGDTACLMQPFCYASGISNEANQSNPVHALGQSISFGRFMSESLAWEKWSSFSQNRYVEEAERFSRPGSVAQKKAFFEAHYKKLAAQRAAALLEQSNSDNAASHNATQQENEAVTDDNDNSQSTNPSMSESESNSVKVELQSQPKDVDTHMEASENVTTTPPVPTPMLKQNSNSEKENLASMSKKKPPVSSSKVLKAKTSKLTSTPVKSTEKDTFATPTSKNPALSSIEKKRTPRKTLNMSNFTPIREINRLTASVMRKFESARGGAGSSKASKDSSSTPLRTPTMASKNEGQKHSSVTPLTEKKGTKTPIDSSASGSKTAGPKWRLLSAVKKVRSPIISSPFTLRTEERAVRRKKKLEEKFNANETQKMQLRARLKEKAETEIRKLRESFCFKARPLPDFYKERKASKEETSKGTASHTESPKQGRKAIESRSPLPPEAQRASGTRPLGSNSIMNNMRIRRQMFSMGTKITDSTK